MKRIPAACGNWSGGEYSSAGSENLPVVGCQQIVAVSHVIGLLAALWSAAGSPHLGTVVLGVAALGIADVSVVAASVRVDRPWLGAGGVWHSVGELRAG